MVEDADGDCWLSIARKALQAGGLDPFLVDHALTADETVAPAPVTVAKGRFVEARHVAFTAVDQWSRADALRWHQKLKQDVHDKALGQQIARSLGQNDLSLFDYFLNAHGPRTKLGKVVKACRTATEKSLAKALPWAGHTALVTGAGPESIAESIVVQLLEGGARVIVTTSRPTRERVRRFKGLYRSHAGRGAELHIVPFDQGSFEDIDALCDWLFASRFETRGTERVQLKGPWRPTLCFPFGAVPAEGDPTTLDAEIAATLQVNLIGVEKLIGRLAKGMSGEGQDAPAVHVVLPLSPNHGQMGRDGLYAESKIGLETLLKRWQAEYEQWGRYTTLCGAKIGWVRGTGLMHGLDRVYQTIESEMGIETYTPAQMAELLLSHCTQTARKKAKKSPQVADLTGGFGKAKGLREMINQALADAQSALGVNETSDPTHKLPLNTYAFPTLPDARGTNGLDPKDCIAIVGYGEIGPFGNSRARWAVETDGQLNPEAAVEVAWLCGHIKFEAGEWVDVESGDPIDTSRLAEIYELDASIGIRENETFDPLRVESFTEVLLSEDMVFHVPDAALAETFRLQDPEHTEVINEGDGCRVVRRACCRVRVPRIDALDRDIAGQLPTGFDATRLGFDAQQLDQIDPVAIFNLLATAEAFRTMGIEPEELWSEVHPARIACTQGSGIGGMRAQHRLYADAALGQNTQSDVLQETLINVGAAYPGMYLYGGYGPMINPVSACATAAVSIEIGADLIRSGKADFAVAGAFDDFSVEGVRGFAEMQANRRRRAEGQGARPRPIKPTV